MPQQPATAEVVEVVVVSCSCQMFPLDKAVHLTTQGAWNAAAEHVSLNPDLCHPNMYRDTVPARLAATIGA